MDEMDEPAWNSALPGLVLNFLLFWGFRRCRVGSNEGLALLKAFDCLV